MFIGHVESLSIEENELIVLDCTEDRVPKSATGVSLPIEEALPTLAQRSNAKHVWYVSPSVRASREVHDGFTLSIAEPSDIFSRIFPLPNKFDAMVASDVDVNGPIFKDAFQPRSARISAASARDLTTLDTELARWADSSAAEQPLLLLGDRGSGKTWQLLKFCEKQYQRSQESRGLHVPALYVSLRRMFSYLDDSRQSSLGLYGLLTERYSWFAVKWNWRMFQALLECNQLIICLDGFDEVEIQPSEEEVQEHLRRIVSMLPMGSRFIISSRTTHFSSYDRLYSLECWPGVDVRGGLRVLELVPFRMDNLTAYAARIEESEPSPSVFQRLRHLLEDKSPYGELTTALRRCCRQPALLARLTREIRANPDVSDFDLIQRVIQGTLIEFNIDHERTRPLHLDARGVLRVFDSSTRVGFLGELAWFMAERNLDVIDLDRLPARLIRMFGLESEALKRDVRSQTVFELLPLPTTPTRDHPDSGTDGYETPFPKTGPSLVRFALSVEGGIDILFHTPAGSGPLALTSEAMPSGSSEVQSVAEAYFLSSHIAARLEDWRTIPGVNVADTLQFLGRVRLDRLTGAMLKALLEKNSESATTSAQFVAHAKHLVAALAAKGSGNVFSHRFRFLMKNLECLGYLKPTEREQLDPWTPTLTGILDSATVLGRYEFVLVPGISSSKISSIAQEVGVHAAGGPFLLGVHEITNEQYAKFIRNNPDWAVERITRAASDVSTPPSEYAHYTNEYHLYFWEEVRNTPSKFEPPSSFLRHPVVYVSWYAAQAFCNWLSQIHDRTPIHPIPPASDINISQTMASPGFRLPTAAEWWWSSQGPSDRAEYPWDNLPYECAFANTHASDEDDQQEPAAIRWFQRYRNAATSVLLDSGRRSSEVAYDDDVGPFGAIGLIGNVKEWVQDWIREGPKVVAKALVCGTTAHLSKMSFRIGYNAPLFPENTNPDVGFRIARSLSSREAAAFESRERELADLPPHQNHLG